jgi:hypothetical protein
MKLLTTICLIAAWVVCGSENVPADGSASTRPANVYVSSPVLPAGLKRVVVLPLANEGSSQDLASGCETLAPVLQAQLVKAARFETVNADPNTLRGCTGKLSWTGDEVLPADFFSNLKNVYACDGVLFSQVTVFRASPPLAVGWRLKLVDASNGNILWAADEIFDAANLDEAKEAQQYERAQQPHHNFAYGVYTFAAWCIHVPVRSALDDQWNILNSPRYFGEYSAEKLLETMPQR